MRFNSFPVPLTRMGWHGSWFLPLPHAGEGRGEGVLVRHSAAARAVAGVWPITPYCTLLSSSSGSSPGGALQGPA